MFVYSLLFILHFLFEEKGWKKEGQIQKGGHAFEGKTKESSWKRGLICSYIVELGKWDAVVTLRVLLIDDDMERHSYKETEEAMKDTFAIISVQKNHQW